MLLQQEGKSLKFEVYFHDGTSQRFSGDSATTAEELLYSIIRKRNIGNPRGFALFKELNGILRVISHEERVVDEMSNLDRFPIPAKKSKKPVKSEQPVRLFFQHHLCLDVKANFSQFDEVTLNLFYAQVRAPKISP